MNEAESELGAHAEVIQFSHRPFSQNADRVPPSYELCYTLEQLRALSMYTNTQKLSSPETQELRKDAGKLLKHLREKAGHSQRTFAAEIGSPVYTFVSQIETGRGRVPPDQIRVWANAYGIEARQFLMMIMRFYDPETFAVLFEQDKTVFDGTAFPDLTETRDAAATPLTAVKRDPADNDE